MCGEEVDPLERNLSQWVRYVLFCLRYQKNMWSGAYTSLYSSEILQFSVNDIFILGYKIPDRSCIVHIGKHSCFSFFYTAGCLFINGRRCAGTESIWKRTSSRPRACWPTDQRTNRPLRSVRHEYVRRDRASVQRLSKRKVGKYRRVGRTVRENWICSQSKQEDGKLESTLRAITLIL